MTTPYRHVMKQLRRQASTESKQQAIARLKRLRDELKAKAEKAKEGA